MNPAVTPTPPISAASRDLVPTLEIADLRTSLSQGEETVAAVDGVSLSIQAGETVGLVGESGCGKTMTALSTLRLLPAGAKIESGAIRLDGTDLVAASDAAMRDIRGREIGVVFQDHLTAFNPTMTIGAQIAEVLRIHRGWDKDRAWKRAEEVLELVDMPHPRERLKQYPHQLSGGLRQRSMIAMALACEPRLLIADEPTTALDVTVQAQIFALLDELKSELNMAILLITHDLGVIAGHADEVAVMYAGRIVEKANVYDLFAQPRHRYTEALLASIPRLDQSAKAAVSGIAGGPPDLLSPPSGCRFHPRCGFATDVCTSTEPGLTKGGSNTYACHHPVGVPETETT